MSGLLAHNSLKVQHDTVKITFPKFLGYITDIAPVAFENEPDCIGYAWFRSTKDNDTIPLHWCRGFEV